MIKKYDVKYFMASVDPLEDRTKSSPRRTTPTSRC